MATNKSSSASAASDNRNWVLPLVLLVLPLGYLWFHLINNLRLEWSTNPQYGYGMMVPLLIAGLLLRRWQHASHEPGALASNPWPAILLCMGLMFLYLPTRLIEEATPAWRPIQWLLGIQIVG